MLRFFGARGDGAAHLEKNATNPRASALEDMETPPHLRGDCARCQSLCCLSLPFDRDEWFAFDKPANVACRHLQPSLGCNIHPELNARGQGGCAAYDCYGAGQRITQELFAGVSWRREPEAGPALFEAFRRLKRVHELRWLLHHCEKLRLSPARRRERAQLSSRLEPAQGMSRESLAALELAELEAAVHGWLRGLAGELSRREGRKRLPLLADTHHSPETAHEG